MSNHPHTVRDAAWEILCEELPNPCRFKDFEEIAKDRFPDYSMRNLWYRIRRYAILSRQFVPQGHLLRQADKAPDPDLIEAAMKKLKW